MELRHNLLECSFVDAIEWFKQTDTVIVPIGSCEKHGAHLVLSVHCSRGGLTGAAFLKKTNALVSSGSHQLLKYPQPRAGFHEPPSLSMLGRL